MARIEDYAVIGDCETAALVCLDGSIDWLCWPNFASAACFAKLLGTEENGFWKIAPAPTHTDTEKGAQEGVAANVSVSRKYRDHTLILETTFTTDDGEVMLIDFMPQRGNCSDLVRIVRGVRGSVEMLSTLSLRFNYGSAIPWVTQLKNGAGIFAVAGPDTVVLRTPVTLKGEDMKTVGYFTVSAGESIPFVLGYGEYGAWDSEGPPPINPEEELASNEEFWCDWASQCPYEGKYHEAVKRSLITLKALTYKPTGGVVAAPTMSLPEQLGGPRNWDYRYCWLRDTTFTLFALMNGGYFKEAEEWLNWLRRTISGSPDQVQIMYGIKGERTLIEWNVPWLCGYENSSPVRVGNAAAGQVQLDIYGEVLGAFYVAQGKIVNDRQLDFRMLRGLVHHLETIWEQPDEGIWETRGGANNFVYSKAMAWVAFDRAIKLAQEWGYEAQNKDTVENWKEARDRCHKMVCERGFSPRLNSFTQSFDSEELDSANLLLPIVGFLPADDPRIIGTVEAIEKQLTQDGFVMRYDTSKGGDGLAGDEGAFLACSFWMVNNLAMIGRRDDAAKLFERLLSLRNDLGLLSEEYDVRNQRLVGNFPQALSHIALISAAFALEDQGELRDRMAEVRSVTNH